MPKKVAVAGAGYIGVELTGIFHALGADVTLFIRSSELLRSFDEIIRHAIMEEYRKSGIKIVESSKLLKLENQGTAGHKLLNVSVERMVEGAIVQEQHEGFEEMIFAIGRKANTEGLGLDAAGVLLDAHGFVIVDEWQQTNVGNVYAVGDICGVAMLTPGLFN